MNRLHAWYCHTGHWARTVERELLDWTLGGARLGDSLLELGAGSGTVTTCLSRHVARITAVDVDARALGRLRDRVRMDSTSDTGLGRHGAPVPVVAADAAALPFEARTFSGVAAFTMVHHVPGIERQRRLLGEVSRVLRPGGTFIGCDAVWTLGLRLFHLGDTFAPVDPDQWAVELEAAGFDVLDVSTAGRYLRWRARSHPSENAGID